jgi:hypothetical protein
MFLEETPPTDQAEIDAPNTTIDRTHFGIMLEHPAAATACASAAKLTEDRAKHSCH